MLKNSCPCCDSRLILDARFDPTGTTTTRVKFEQNLVARFNRLKALINQSINQNDVFALKALRVGDSLSAPAIMMDAEALPSRSFTFDRPAEKVQKFMDWLQMAQNGGILEVQGGAGAAGAAQSAWINTYIDTAYTKGIRDAVGKMRKAGANVSSQWVEQSFFRPVHADRLGLIYTRAYNDLDGITKTMDQQISRILAQGIGEGRSPRELAAQINERVDKIGITRARVLARTEIISAHAEASINAYEEAGLEGLEVDVEFSTAGDGSVCEECDALSGKVFTISESRGIIPVHPNCLPADSLVLSRSGISAVSKRWFDGDMIIISCSSGRVLTCTPNHPVLTDFGWVAAQDINLTHKIICDGGSEWMASADNDHENIVPTIHDVSESFIRSCEVAPTPVPMSGEHFHGDGTAGEIAVIWSDGKLRHAIDTSFSEFADNKPLNLRVVRYFDRVGLSSFALFLKRMLSASGGIVGRHNLVRSLLASHRLPFGRFRFGLSAESDTSISESVLDSATADAKLARNLIDGLSCKVFADDIISIKREFFSGHVYNLETGEGWYSANGIITHNCRCGWSPLVQNGSGINLV
jgi:SPP1 gp7 family putative phage head morphogenesis protein